MPYTIAIFVLLGLSVLYSLFIAIISFFRKQFKMALLCIVFLGISVAITLLTIHFRNMGYINFFRFAYIPIITFLTMDILNLLIHLKKELELKKVVIVVVVSYFSLYFIYQSVRYITTVVIVAQIAESHIEGNVSDRDEFDRLLERNLRNHFRPKYDGEIRVEYSLLRDGPTQTGISFPKYYLWVSINRGGELIDQGAVRITAIEKEKFEVTDFLSIEDFRSNKNISETVFPKDVCKKIEQKLSKELN
jgi:hypothetical protein